MAASRSLHGLEGRQLARGSGFLVVVIAGPAILFLFFFLLLLAPVVVAVASAVVMPLPLLLLVVEGGKAPQVRGGRVAAVARGGAPGEVAGDIPKA